MGVSEHERTLKMKENYMVLFEQGLTPGEIAKRYDLDPSTVYAHLSEIAEEHGMKREDLLVRPHGEHVRYKGRLKKIDPIDPSEFLEHIERLLGEAKELHTVIKKQIKTQEKVAKRIEMEEESWATE